MVKDQSGAMIPKAAVTITNDVTGLSATAHTAFGRRYTIQVDSAGREPAWPILNASQI